MIDLRTVKCACGHPDCIRGISFDITTNGAYEVLLLRFHYLDNQQSPPVEREQHIQLDEATRDELVKQLMDYSEKPQEK